MMKEKESGRPSGAGTTAKRNDIVLHTYSITKSITIQVLIAILSVICLIVFTAWVVLDIIETNSAQFVPVEHKVVAGDTLWTIAKQYKPDSMTMDRYMAWVYEHNDGGYIYPGDTVIMAEVVQ